MSVLETLSWRSFRCPAGLRHVRTLRPRRPDPGPHGFSIDWLRLGTVGSTGAVLSRDKQVLCVMRGSLELRLNRGLDQVVVRLQEREICSVPAHVWRELRSVGEQTCELTVTTAGDHRKWLVWAQEVVDAA